MAESDVRQRTTANGTPDGASSATKRTQESKGTAKEGTRTSRSVSSTSARSPSAGEKKIPPIKAPVGTTPPPKIKQAKSKIGSLENVTHKPKGGDKKVESKKLEWNASSKVGSLAHANYKPGGGDKKIITQKVDFKNVQSKVGSKENLKHKPGGGNLKIASEKLDFKAKAASKVGSLDNAKHKPGGGNVAIKSEKLLFKDKAAPKIHSRSGSDRGSSHGGSETQSPVMPSSPAPPEGMPPLCEDDSPSSQEEPKPEKVECNGNGENAQGPPSTDASPNKSPDKAEDATEDQLIAF